MIIKFHYAALAPSDILSSSSSCLKLTKSLQQQKWDLKLRLLLTLLLQTLSKLGLKNNCSGSGLAPDLPPAAWAPICLKHLLSAESTFAKRLPGLARPSVWTSCMEDTTLPVQALSNNDMGDLCALRVCCLSAMDNHYCDDLNCRNYIGKNQ